MDLSLKTNKYQSDLKPLIEGLPTDVINSIYTAIDEIPYIHHFIKENRLTIDDAPKDDEGKVIINFTEPHILSDMDYFRQPAIRFQTTGNYTDAIRSQHKKSAWAIHWANEGYKCLTKVVNPDTGEWIPGDLYFYLNYSPIMRIIKDDKGEEVDRIFELPDLYDGDYLYFHYLYKARHYSDRFIKGLHGGAIKCRGRGYSFKGSSMIAKRFVIGDSPKAQKKVRSLALASEKEFLIKDGILNKFIDITTHCLDHTGWASSMGKGSMNTMEWRLSYTTKKDNLERGRKNEVIGVSMKDNPGKARGKRANLILYEEFGKFPNLLNSYRTNRPSTEAGPLAFGQQVLFGTGGEEGNDFSGAEELIFHPEGYRILGIPNIYDKGTDGSNNCIFFSPEVLNIEGMFDHNGNSDVTRALVHIMYDRWTVKSNTSDPNQITGHIAEHPITISEAIMKTGSTLFPVVDLKEHRDTIRVQGVKFYQDHYVGDLTIVDGEVKWILNDKQPLRNYKIQNDNKEGAIEIFELPKLGADNKPIKGRYICGVDGFDDDEGTSLGSIFVFDLFHDVIVAEYSGRPKFANDFYEICRRLGMFYNAEILYENNKKGMFAYFLQQGSISMLHDVPQFLRDQHMAVKVGSGNNKSKGVHATKDINYYALRLQRDWMLTTAHPSYQEIDEEGNIITSRINIEFIRSIGYIEEAIIWNSEINTDRVSAMGMVMLLREEKKQFLDTIMSNSSNATKLAEDDYFTQEYDERFSHYTNEFDNI